MASGSLAMLDPAPAGASPLTITVHCPADSLADAINGAAAGSTLLVDGTCTGNFYIDKDLTLSGPAILDGGGIPTTFGATLNVAAGTVVLNDLTIQDGVGIFGLGGGLWNGGNLTLNGSIVTNNTAAFAGGVFNDGQLTLNGSSVSHNTATTYGGGGIFNCAASLHDFGLCTGPPGSLTLNNSNVTDNVAAGSGDGGGILNDVQAAMTLDRSTVSGNTAATTGGGINNDAQGSMTLTNSSVSGNTAGSGGGIFNNGTATLNQSMVSNNSSTGPAEFWSGGGGLSTTGTSQTTVSNSIVRGNTAAWLGGGIFAGGPMTINNSIVTGNTAGPAGGGLVAWDGATTVAGSVFSNNSDQGVFPDSPPGVWVAPADFGGFFTNNPTFTTTQSTYH